MGKVLELVPSASKKIVSLEYQIICCATDTWAGHTHKPNSTKDLALKEIDSLLKLGHKDVQLYRVQETLLDTFQPRKDHGKVCLRMFGWECGYDHNHLEV